MARGQAEAGDPRHQQIHRVVGQQGGILLNGGELIGAPVRLRDIVKADDGR